MLFCGNEICCASYACLNAMKDESISLPLFELSTGTPFGIGHRRNERFDRLLTTYQDPNQGLDQAIVLWGYKVNRYDCQTANEAVYTIKKQLANGHSVLLGPIDMGKISYYPMPFLLQRMDHYIVLEPWSECSAFCIDSEGWNGYQIPYQKLHDSLSVSSVPEACGKITIRCVEKELDWNLNNILYFSYLRSSRNLLMAEQNGEGSQAITDCWEYISGQEMYLWKLPLAYDIQYLKQRKHLLLWYIDQLKQAPLFNMNILLESKEIVSNQNLILTEMYFLLNRGTIKKNLFYKLAKLERSLTEKWRLVCNIRPSAEEKDVSPL